ncbi:unnamed protein product [Ilex paraguariensis]|uniref:Uncharacterized protein n=1 Tax=Ilex paraguariensis TaxID=185542 RepID=A0ABC8V1E5_9AQUA
MDWWRRVRRVWAAVTSCVKPRETTGKYDNSSINGSGGHIAEGLLKLRDDVQTCEYQDVHVMWNILSRSDPQQMIASSAGTQSSQRTKSRQYLWRNVIWSNHKRASPFPPFN